MPTCLDIRCPSKWRVVFNFRKCCVLAAERPKESKGNSILERNEMDAIGWLRKAIASGGFFDDAHDNAIKILVRQMDDGSRARPSSRYGLNEESYGCIHGPDE